MSSSPKARKVDLRPYVKQEESDTEAKQVSRSKASTNSWFGCERNNLQINVCAILKYEHRSSSPCCFFSPGFAGDVKDSGYKLQHT